MKLQRHFVLLFLYVLYVISVMINLNIVGDILSPIVSFMVFWSTLRCFVLNNERSTYNYFGGFLSLGILTWSISSVVWTVIGLSNEMTLIKVGCGFTNLFYAIALTIFGFDFFRRWKGVQVMLDSLVIAFCIISLIWIIIFDEDYRRFLNMQTDLISTTTIITDIIIITWLAIWYLSVRKGHIPLFLRVMTTGAAMYVIIDLVYFYQKFSENYKPNTILEALYLLSFIIIALGGEVYLRKGYSEETSTNNGKIGIRGLLLLMAPLIIFLTKGFMPYHIILQLIVILAYYVISYYIQRSIYKEELLKSEKNQNMILEQMVMDRTEELVLKNQELERMVNRDEVTGLFNRRYISNYLKKSIEDLSDNETILLIYIDINKFKMISTMFSNKIADALLKTMGERLKAVERYGSETVLASYGRDVFAIAICGKYNYNHGLDMAEEIVSLCGDIYEIEEDRIRLTVSIGISIYPYDAKSRQELFQHADMAMVQAKMMGPNTAKAFDSKLSEIMFRRNNIELMLKRIVIEEELTLYYQPQVDTFNKQVFGFEALLRWNTPAGEHILPGEFIPIAEETGIIIPIGAWVLHKALIQLSEWNKQGDKKYSMSINVSNRQLETDQFYQQLKQEIEELGLDPGCIDIEITETIQLHENKMIARMLDQIKGLGVNISIDDFGTGYSTLFYLKILAMDRIKIARELISRIHEDSFDYELVRSLVAVAKAKGIRVIAEGVELKEQYEKLKEMDCDEIQGFYFGRPTSVRDIEITYL